jgi:DME family drug/metabolite transporter
LRTGRNHGFALVAFGAAIWGSDALFRRGLALELPASVVVFAEHLILVAVTFPIAFRALRRRPRLGSRGVVELILVGAGSSALATVLFTAAFTYGSPTTPLLLQKLQPLFAVVGAHFLLRERLRPKYAVFFALGVGGAYLIAFPDPLTTSMDSTVAALLAVGAALLWAMGTVLGRDLSALLSFKELTALRFAVGLPASALILLIGGEFSTLGALKGGDLVALALLALVPGLLALLIYYRGLRDVPAAAATVAELAFPLSAIVINRIAFNTVLSGTQWLGVLVLSGTILTMTGLASRGSWRVGVIVGQEPAWRAEPRMRQT